MAGRRKSAEAAPARGITFHGRLATRGPSARALLRGPDSGAARRSGRRCSPRSRRSSPPAARPGCRGWPGGAARSPAPSWPGARAVLRQLDARGQREGQVLRGTRLRGAEAVAVASTRRTAALRRLLREGQQRHLVVAPRPDPLARVPEPLGDDRESLHGGVRSPRRRRASRCRDELQGVAAPGSPAPAAFVGALHVGGHHLDRPRSGRRASAAAGRSLALVSQKWSFRQRR